MKATKIAAVAITGVLGLACLAGCATETKEKPLMGSDTSSLAEESSSQATSQAKADTPAGNVIISDVQADKMQLLNPDEPTALNYRITFTAENRNDFSVNVAPAFEADVTLPSPYGGTDTKHSIIGGNGVFITFYGLATKEESEPLTPPYVQPFGLAAGEKKEIVYEFNTRWGELPTIFMFESLTDTSAQPAGKVFDLKEGAYSMANLELTNLAVADKLAWQSQMTYISAEDCDLDFTYSDGFITGSITNTTDDRWKSAEIVFAAVNGPMAITGYWGGDVKVALDHIDKGKTVDFAPDGRLLYLDGLGSMAAEAESIAPTPTVIGYLADTN